MADYNYTEATNLLGTQKANNQSFLAGQAATSEDFLNRYKNAIAGQETMSAMAKRIGSELNLPTLSENAYNVNKVMREIPQTYSAATRGFDVNANQLSRITGQKQSELAPTLATANEALAQAQNTLNTQMGYEQYDQEKALKPFETEQSLLTDRLAREATFYSQENENELNTIIAKIQSGIQVSEAEKDRAQQLAIAEMGYKAKKEELAAGSWSEITIGGNKYRINLTTGEKQLLGPASSSSSGSGNALSYLTGGTTKTTTPTKTDGFTADTKTEVSSTTLNPYGFSSQSNYDTYNKSINPAAYNTSGQITLPSNIRLNPTTTNTSGLYLLGK